MKGKFLEHYSVAGTVMVTVCSFIALKDQLEGTNQSYIACPRDRACVSDGDVKPL